LTLDSRCFRSVGLLMPALVLGVLAAVVVVLDIWATRTVVHQTDLTSRQRRTQVLFVWLLPVIGAWIAIEIYRPSRPHHKRRRLAADEIHPLVEQATRPIAQDQMEAAEQYLEREMTGMGHEAPADSHFDGSH